MKAENAFVVMNTHVHDIITVHASYAHAKKMYDALNEQRNVFAGMRSPYGIFTLTAAIRLIQDNNALEESYSHYAD